MRPCVGSAAQFVQYQAERSGVSSMRRWLRCTVREHSAALGTQVACACRYKRSAYMRAPIPSPLLLLVPFGARSRCCVVLLQLGVVFLLC